jgi:hypothetical protein
MPASDEVQDYITVREPALTRSEGGQASLGRSRGLGDK